MSEAQRTVRVELGARSYSIEIGSGLLPRAGRLIERAVGARRIIVITDETVAKLHLDAVMESLDGTGLSRIGEPIVVPAGESSKSFSVLNPLMENILSRGIDRKVVLVALGGGVIGDLVGFCAAIALRGLDFVQIPTTLLAQVDSSVGGKTGINAPSGKNLIGAFHQPRLVIADSGALATLPPRERAAGYAEIVKYGLIDRPDFFAWLEKNGAAILAGDREAVARAVAVSCEAKADIVAADEREAGVRALLNLGHTFGHALETEMGYGADLLHGEAVAIGMVMAFDLSVSLGLCPPADAARVRAHLSGSGLPVAPPPGCDPATMLAHMRKDKKVEDGRLRLILTRGIGAAFIADDVEADDILTIWQRAKAA